MNIGIDLGTSNIVVCEARRGQYNYIPIDDNAEIMMPSVLMYTRGRAVVGAEAKNSRLIHPSACISGSKVHMGSDKVWEIDGMRFTPELVAEEFFKRIVRELRRRTGEEEDIVATITVPACFSQKQIELTEQAAINGGITVKNIVQEPIAAAKAARLNGVRGGKLFVIDIGGGTFDISVIDTENTANGEVTRVIAVGGSASLGGNDFDEAVYENILLPAVVQVCGDNFSEQLIPEQLAHANTKLMTIAERIKYHFQKCQDMYCEDVFDILPEDVEIKATFSDYKNAVSECIEKARAAIDEVIEDLRSRLNISPQDMDNVIIVGGMAKEVMLRELAAEIFGAERVIEAARPFTFVAEGAARYAAERSLNVPAMLSVDIGIMSTEADGSKKFFAIMNKNTSLNDVIKSKLVVGNAADNSNRMIIEVCERSGGQVKPYTEIIINTELKPRGENKVNIEFSLDTNRILSVHASYLGHELEVTKTISIKQ